MSKGSLKDTILSATFAMTSMAFLAGIFLMRGVDAWLRGDWMFALYFVLIPLFVIVIVLHTRRMLKAAEHHRLPGSD